MAAPTVADVEKAFMVAGGTGDVVIVIDAELRKLLLAIVAYLNP